MVSDILVYEDRQTSNFNRKVDFMSKELILVGEDDLFAITPSSDESGICLSVLRDDGPRCFASVVDDGENFSLVSRRKDFGYDITALKNGDPIPLERYKHCISDKAIRIKTKRHTVLAFHTVAIPEHLLSPYMAIVAILEGETLIPICVLTTLDGTIRISLAK